MRYAILKRRGFTRLSALKKRRAFTPLSTLNMFSETFLNFLRIRMQKVKNAINHAKVAIMALIKIIIGFNSYCVKAFLCIMKKSWNNFVFMYITPY